MPRPLPPGGPLHTIAFRLPAALVTALDARCQQTGRSRSDTIRSALEYVLTHTAPPPDTAPTKGRR